MKTRKGKVVTADDLVDTFIMTVVGTVLAIAAVIGVGALFYTTFPWGVIAIVVVAILYVLYLGVYWLVG